MAEGVVTDNGNWILDVHDLQIQDPALCWNPKSMTSPGLFAMACSPFHQQIVRDPGVARALSN